MDEVAEGVGATNGHATWTSAMSAFMLSNLANVVAGGAKTSKGFKKVHLNACARAVNEKFNTTRTGEQIKNHLKTWQIKWAKLNRLRKLSAAGWDENNFIITLDAEHYNSYIQSDAEFLNKPLDNYAEMQTIFGNNMATGNFAKDSSAALGTDIDETETGEGTDEGATSNASKTKKAKIVQNEEEGLIGAFNRVGDNLAKAIEKVGSSDNDVPDDLFDNLNNLPGFEETHISFYYAYLVAHPHIARAFNKLPFNHKLNWVALFITDKFPGQ